MCRKQIKSHKGVQKTPMYNLDPDLSINDIEPHLLIIGVLSSPPSLPFSLRCVNTTPLTKCQHLNVTKPHSAINYSGGGRVCVQVGINQLCGGCGLWSTAS